MVNCKMLLLLKSVDATNFLFEEMYTEVSFGSHMVEEREVELPQPVVPTTGSEESPKMLLCQLGVRKQTITVLVR